MKIGTSFHRCLLDLLKGVVDYDDVLCIVTHTRVEDVAHLMIITDDYWTMPRNDTKELSDFPQEKLRHMARQLWDDGKLHQPRLHGNHLGHDLTDTWYDLVPAVASTHESVQSAWQHYRMLSKLVHGDR